MVGKSMELYARYYNWASVDDTSHFEKCSYKPKTVFSVCFPLKPRRQHKENKVKESVHNPHSNQIKKATTKNKETQIIEKVFCDDVEKKKSGRIYKSLVPPPVNRHNVVPLELSYSYRFSYFNNTYNSVSCQ